MNKKLDDYRYRTCRVCGKDWNVSVKADNDKHYTCPLCRAGKKTGGANNAGSTADQCHIHQKSL